MRILRNYILNECFLPFVMSLGVLTFVFLLGYLPQLANKVINQGVDILSVTLAFFYNIPVLLGYTLPVAALATVILTFSRFSSDNEIIAIRASGISLRSLLAPLVAIGIILSLVMLILNDRVIPNAYEAQRTVLQTSGARNPAALLEPGTFIDAFNGNIIFIYRIEHGRMYSVRIWQPQPDGKPTRMISAQEGEFTPVPGQQKVLLKLINGTSDEPDFDNPNNFYKLNFKTSFMTLDMARKAGKLEKKPKGMGLKELDREIRRLEKTKDDIYRNALIAEYHRKLSWALSPLIFILLGFPMAVITHRRQKSANLLMAVIFAAPYYLLSVGCQALAQQAFLPPDVLMWLPNIIGGAIVLVLNYKLCAS
jgi:lipopolysaccharide export system permease protein